MELFTPCTLLFMNAVFNGHTSLSGGRTRGDVGFLETGSILGDRGEVFAKGLMIFGEDVGVAARALTVVVAAAAEIEEGGAGGDITLWAGEVGNEEAESTFLLGDGGVEEEDATGGTTGDFGDGFGAGDVGKEDEEAETLMIGDDGTEVVAGGGAATGEGCGDGKAMAAGGAAATGGAGGWAGA
ncbi:uncharacterized protein LOC132294741 [Cornus florida]|uniref:uncharacterized protein LOC132294741 n=1 Tax=Cornus florida TaxID=4283 RepID=UPI0028A23776|nr:uncharacterized protein LOC132294741 [Cornus florida]XP_059648695.1 uncharacterized protein LOC132294741 [Cornus florida]